MRTWFSMATSFFSCAIICFRTLLIARKASWNRTWTILKRSGAPSWRKNDLYEKRKVKSWLCFVKNWKLLKRKIKCVNFHFSTFFLSFYYYLKINLRLLLSILHNFKLTIIWLLSNDHWLPILTSKILVDRKILSIFLEGENSFSRWIEAW